MRLQVIPVRGAPKADFDLIMASQPYRARAKTEFKAKRVVAPLCRALAPGGRLLGIHSCGNDPGLEIVQRLCVGLAGIGMVDALADAPGRVRGTESYDCFRTSRLRRACPKTDTECP